MILDVILGMLSKLVGWVSGLLPRIPLGPLAPAPRGQLWAKLDRLLSNIPWLAKVLPVDAFGHVVVFVMTCAVTALGVYIVKFALRVLRIGG